VFHVHLDHIVEVVAHALHALVVVDVAYHGVTIMA
jgi:hypothetical protein